MEQMLDYYSIFDEQRMRVAVMDYYSIFGEQRLRVAVMHLKVHSYNGKSS